MSSVVASYTSPTLYVTHDNIERLIDVRALVAGGVAYAIRFSTLITDGLKTGIGIEPAESGESKAEALHIKGSGFLRVKRICKGWETDAPISDALGSLNFIAGFTEKGLDPVVWGTAIQCKTAVDNERLTLDGSINWHVGGVVDFNSLGSMPFTFVFATKLTVGSATQDLNQDFRVLPDGAIEYRVFLDSDYAIYWESGTNHGFKTANGSLACDFMGKICTQEDGSSLSW